jgi:hypothetical protein
MANATKSIESLWILQFENWLDQEREMNDMVDTDFKKVLTYSEL